MTAVEVRTIPVVNPDQSVSAFFAPKFIGNAPLGSFPDWSDWPAIINAAATNLAVEMFNTNTNTWVSKTFVVSSAAPRSDVWRALFGFPSTLNTGKYNFLDRSGATYLSWDGEAAAGVVDNFYKSIVTAFPEDIPTGSDIPPAAKTQLQTIGQEFRDSLMDATGGSEDLLGNWNVGHMLSACGNHPKLLRLLGLIIDFDVTGPLTDLNAIRVGLTNYAASSPTHTASLLPLAMALDLDTMVPQQGGETYFDLVGGFLEMDDWTVRQFDHAASTQQLALWLRSLRDGDPEPVPALATAGLSILRKGAMASGVGSLFSRHSTLRQNLINQRLTGSQAFMKRGDVIIGWRVDVRDVTKDGANGAWRSLFERTTADTPGYGFGFGTPSPALGSFKDEGWTTLAMFTNQVETQNQPSAPDTLDPPPPWQADAQQRISEVLYVWDGWSGAAPPPGKIIETETGGAIDPDANTQQTGGPAQVAVNYKPTPATLPQLRYGHQYKMRARAVNMAGGGVPLTATSGASTESPLVRFGRTHPLPAPVAARQTDKAVPGVRESIANIVIKSELGQNDASVDEVTRIFFTPSGTQQTCERHGLPGDGDDPSMYGLIASRDPLSVDSQTNSDPLSGERTVAVNGTTGPPRPVAAYLPDPGVGGLTIDGLPTAVSTAQVPQDGTWPNVAAWRIRVRAGSQNPVINPDADTSVLVSVPKAITAPIEVSCSPEALADWFASQGAGSAVTAAIMAGRQWMVSGRLPMTLIHATRLPLSLPVPLQSSLSASRSDLDNPDLPGNTLGSLVAHIDAATDVHPHSTGRIKLTGTWVDPTDDGPGTAAPSVTPPIATEFGTLNVNYDDLDGTVPGSAMVLDVNDTKAHDVDVTVDAFSRYSAHFTQREVHDFPAGTTVELNDPPVVPGFPGIVARSVQVRLNPGDSPLPRKEYTANSKGEITAVAGGALEGATDVQVDYIPLPVKRNSTEAGATPPVLVVPASAAPSRPDVIEIMPAVSRQVRDHEGTTRISHSGQVLRLHLQRPWWTSGRDERLAVVIDGDDDNTQIGRDPVFTGSGPTFPQSTDIWHRAITSGVFDGVTVAGHDVTFDAARDLWVADLEVRADLGYRPFVRPVIARLQPDAKPTAHLSERVMLDPHRLGVNRQVTVYAGESAVKVSVVGPEHAGLVAGGNTHFNRITVTLQEKEASVADPDLAWIDVPGSTQVLGRVPRGDGWTNWSGKIALPGPASNYRIVIDETEPSKRESTPGVVSLARETVYVETVELG